jgi:hypothetical protein
MSLIKDLDKKPYQEFLVEMGIDRVSILIPVKQANAFIMEANETRPSSVPALETLIKKFEGQLVK